MELHFEIELKGDIPIDWHAIDKSNHISLIHVRCQSHQSQAGREEHLFEVE